MNLLRTIGEHYIFGYLRSQLTPGHFFPKNVLCYFFGVLLFNFIDNDIKQCKNRLQHIVFELWLFKDMHNTKR